MVILIAASFGLTVGLLIYYAARDYVEGARVNPKGQQMFLLFSITAMTAILGGIALLAALFEKTGL
jgi:hypothetical protein